MTPAHTSTPESREERRTFFPNRIYEAQPFVRAFDTSLRNDSGYKKQAYASGQGVRERYFLFAVQLKREREFFFCPAEARSCQTYAAPPSEVFHSVTRLEMSLSLDWTRPSHRRCSLLLLSCEKWSEYLLYEKAALQANPVLHTRV